MQAMSWEGTVGHFSRSWSGFQGKEDWTEHQRANFCPCADSFKGTSATCRLCAFDNILMLKYGRNKLADIPPTVTS